MFRTKLFWSDYFEDRAPKRPPHRALNIAKWLGVGLAAVTLLMVVCILLLRWIPVPTSAFMLAQRLDGHRVHYRWVAWPRISPAAPIAVVASEDQRFPFHWGIDFAAIADALEQNHHSRRLRGASTISQQVAKNLFLWSGRSWLRKELEAVLTVIIEACWSKRRILEVYLNIAQFGPETFGVAAATTAHRPVSTDTKPPCWPRCCPIPTATAFRRHRPTCGSGPQRFGSILSRFIRFLGAPLLRLKRKQGQGSNFKLAPAWPWQWSADWPQQSMTRHRT